MALTGKTIGQLTYLQFPTNDTLIPVELSGDTFHIAFSAANYTEVTYSDLSTGLQSGELTPGHFYLITDFQTIYDQPNWDENGNPITTGNNKSGTTEPLLVLAISTSELSPTAYSALHPTDKITYDVSWFQTEVTNTPAKGRITERIDTIKNNRTDYDFRAVQFVRYVGFFSEIYRLGTVSLDGSTGAVTGVGTQFSSVYSVGGVIGIYYSNNAPISCFRYYEIISITDDTNMTVWGKTMATVNNTYHSNAVTLPNHSSPYQCNLTGGTFGNSTQYYTFNSDLNYNTYIGDNQEYNTFILSNNVFKSGDYNNNTLAGNCVGNTFDDDMDSNSFGPYSSYNIITNDFDRNTCGYNFSNNIIDCDMAENVIAQDFFYNMIGDEDGSDFDFNNIGYQFASNFITMSNGDFAGNIIGENFRNNIIDDGFANNSILSSFSYNKILGNFNRNSIGHYFNANNIETVFEDNHIVSNFFTNNVFAGFQSNLLQNNTYSNVFGDSGNTGTYSFIKNTVGANFNNNLFTATTLNNIIGSDCQVNIVGTEFAYNQIGTQFQNNTIGNNFGSDGATPRGNVIGGGFKNNVVGPQFYDNTLGDNCTGNNFGEEFINNKISHGFNSVTTINYDTLTPFRNNTFSFSQFNTNLTFSGGTGGNPVFYTNIPTNVTLDYADSNQYVTFLSGGTIVRQAIILT